MGNGQSSIIIVQMHFTYLTAGGTVYVRSICKIVSVSLQFLEQLAKLTSSDKDSPFSEFVYHADVRSR